MKIIKYNLCTIIEDKEILSPIEMGWSEANEAIAKAEAYNSEYTIEDDGVEETYQPTIQEQLDAQAAAIMELAEVIYGG